MDVAPIERKELWGHDPFGAVIKNDTLYGRGACDMKAAIAAMTVAAETLSRWRKSLKPRLKPRRTTRYQYDAPELAMWSLAFVSNKEGA
jgi:hypothetical protein